VKSFKAEEEHAEPIDPIEALQKELHSEIMAFDI